MRRVSGENDSELLVRTLAFERRLDLGACETVTEAEWGTAFLSPSIPLVWDASFIAVEQPGCSAADVAALADEAIGGAGMEHRSAVMTDPSEGARLAPEFEAMDGWSVERGVQMVLRRPPDRPSKERVREYAGEDLLQMRRRMIASDLPIMGIRVEETVEQLIEWDRRICRVGGDRWFGARAGGQPVSCCQLLAGEGIGQVETVATLTDFRERGLGRAVTLAAAEASRTDGNALTYLGALADDWPRLLYENLGFDPIGITHIFRRRPT